MTDDLIARLRLLQRYHGDNDAGEAADALEAQARRIAELEAGVKSIIDDFNSLCEAKNARIAELEAALKDTTVCLVAAVSLLESGGKKAAPSNEMFDQMLVDYKNGVKRARAALEKKND